MSIAKVTEIIASSGESFEDAIEKGIDKASETLLTLRNNTYHQEFKKFTYQGLACN